VLLVVVVALCVLGVKLAGPSIQRAVTGIRGGPTPLDPTLFAAGACQAFAPTSGDRHMTVFLDAGHGGLDPGALGTTESGQTVTEASLTLPMELDTMARLRADGFRVVVSRTSDTTVLRLQPDDVDGNVLSLLGAHDDVAARAQCADDAGASALVGIYLDAGGSPDNAGSLAAYDTARPFAQHNEQLATLVDSDVQTAFDTNPQWQIPDIGAVNDDSVGSISGNPGAGGLAGEAADYDHLMLLGPAQAGYFSTPSTMPGTVVEPLFITDPFEATVADSVAGQQAVAHGVAQAVEQFLVPTSSTTTTTSAAS